MKFVPQGQTFTHLKEGDTVFRILAWSVCMPLVVSKIDGDRLEAWPVLDDGAGPLFTSDHYTFDRKTGAEIDEEIGWGLSGTGSFLTMNPNFLKENVT